MDSDFEDSFENYYPEIDDFQFTVLGPKDISRVWQNSIEQVQQVIGISFSSTLILLNYFKWDAEKLMEKFFDCNKIKLYEDAKIASPATLNSCEKLYGECGICYSETLLIEINCGHMFCQDCWEGYLTSKITSEGSSQTILCAYPKCGKIVDFQIVLKILKDIKVRQKYRCLMMDSFIVNNKLMRWCSGPGCHCAIKAEAAKPKAVSCKCGHKFCFLCGDTWHDPAPCLFIKKWIKKCAEDTESIKWILKNSKDCPGCSVPVEKTYGCNHMFCQVCKTHYCWICLQITDGKGGAGCVCYLRQTRTTHEKLRASFDDKYFFYHTRYSEHKKSLTLEVALSDKIFKITRDSQDRYNLTSNQMSFLKNALDALCVGRQTLINTYVFAYFLEECIQKAVFEENLKVFANAVEQLSYLLSTEITCDNVNDRKIKIIETTKYCGDWRRSCLKHVYEGYDEGWWTFRNAE